MKLRKPLSEAAQHFRNLWVYEARYLWKKPFAAFLAFEAAFVYLRRSLPILNVVQKRGTGFNISNKRKWPSM